MFQGEGMNYGVYLIAQVYIYYAMPRTCKESYIRGKQIENKFTEAQPIMSKCYAAKYRAEMQFVLDDLGGEGKFIFHL